MNFKVTLFLCNKNSNRIRGVTGNGAHPDHHLLRGGVRYWGHVLEERVHLRVRPVLRQVLHHRHHRARRRRPRGTSPRRHHLPRLLRQGSCD